MKKEGVMIIMRNKERKMLSLLLAGTIAALFVTGCGSTSENTDGETSASAQAATQAVTEASTAEETAAAVTTQAAEETTEETAAVTTTEQAIEGTELTTTMFSLIYPDDWEVNEDNTSDGDSYCYADLTIPDGDGYLVECTVSAIVNEASSYRDSLGNSGIDAYQLVEEKTVETVNIGGVECVEYEGTYWGEPVLYYLGRDEGAGTTVSVMFYGDFQDSRVPDLIRSMNFTLNDTGEVDPPWPWNGEPYSTDAQHTYGVGSMTVTSDWLQFEEPLLADDIFSGRVEVTGDTVWVLLDDTLYEYTYGDGTLTYVSEMDLSEEGDYSELSSDQNGRLYVSGFMDRMLIIENGEIASRIDDVDVTVMHESGNWGISYFFGDTLKKVTLKGDSAKLEDWPLRADEETASAFLSANHVYVSGTSIEKDNEAVWVFDTEGNQQFELGNASMGEPGWMGSITDVVETENGFIILDGNMRSLFFYGTDGDLIATVDDADLFGSDYPWISSAAMMPDGSILIALVDERADESADELLLFRLSGY